MIHVNKFLRKRTNIFFLLMLIWVFSYFLSTIIPGPRFSPGGTNDSFVFIFVIVTLIVTLVLYYMSVKLLKSDRTY